MLLEFKIVSITYLSKLIDLWNKYPLKLIFVALTRSYFRCQTWLKYDVNEAISGSKIHNNKSQMYYLNKPIIVIRKKKLQQNNCFSIKNGLFLNILHNSALNLMFLKSKQTDIFK